MSCLLRIVHDRMGVIDLRDRMVSKLTRLRYIFGALQVPVRSKQKLIRFAEPVMRAQTGIDVERIVQAFAIVDRHACLIMLIAASIW